MSLMQRLSLLLLGSLMSLAVALPAKAIPFSYSMSENGRSAEVTFEVSGTDLIVTLANKSTNDAMAPTDVLTGVFFNIAGNPVITPIAASLYTGSSIICKNTGHAGDCPTQLDPNGLMNGEWAFKSNVNLRNAKYGISSSGLGIFGPSDLFPNPTNLQGPVDPDGIQYGITTEGDNANTANGGLGGNNLVKNKAQFKFALNGNADNFHPGKLSDISFQYGTATTEPYLLVPEPASYLLVSLGILGIFIARRSNRQAN